MIAERGCAYFDTSSFLNPLELSGKNISASHQLSSLFPINSFQSKRKNAAVNFSLINKIAMAILRLDTAKKEAWVRKRQRASLDDNYLRYLLDMGKDII